MTLSTGQHVEVLVTEAFVLPDGTVWQMGGAYGDRLYCWQVTPRRVEIIERCIDEQ